MTETQTEGYFTAQELSDRWGGAVSLPTLANWRHRKVGPRPVRTGQRVLYPLQGVLDFEAADQAAPHPHIYTQQPLPDDARAAIQAMKRIRRK